MNWLKRLAQRLYKGRSPEEKLHNVKLYMQLREVEAQREATRIRLALKSGTTRYLG